MCVGVCICVVFPFLDSLFLLLHAGLKEGKKKYQVIVATREKSPHILVVLLGGGVDCVLFCFAFICLLAFHGLGKGCWFFKKTEFVPPPVFVCVYVCKLFLYDCFFTFFLD